MSSLVNHYLNTKTSQVACAKYSMRNARSMNLNATESKAHVTCKRCITQLAKWEAMAARKAARELQASESKAHPGE